MSDPKKQKIDSISDQKCMEDEVNELFDEIEIKQSSSKYLYHVTSHEESLFSDTSEENDKLPLELKERIINYYIDRFLNAPFEFFECLSFNRLPKM